MADLFSRAEHCSVLPDNLDAVKDFIRQHLSK